MFANRSIIIYQRKPLFLVKVDTIQSCRGMQPLAEDALSKPCSPVTILNDLMSVYPITRGHCMAKAAVLW